VASSKRERELARQRAERQAARRAAAAARRRQRNAVVASVLAVLLVVGGLAAAALATRGTSDTVSATPTANGSTAPAASGAASPAAGSTVPPTVPAPGSCSYPSAGQAARPVQPPSPDGVERTRPYSAMLTTSQGRIAFSTATSSTPCTVHSFVSLAAQKYFDGTPCHRLTAQGIFVLQCGDPSGTGRGGPGYSFADENLTGATYPRGTVAMANSGPNTNGSQFFLVYKDSPLPPKYTPFGKLDDASLAVLDKVAAAGAAPADASGNTAPNTPVQVETFVLTPS